MSTTRRPAQEKEFGSDSFMDIVANVVGILIILIVLAGIKVGQYVIDHPLQVTADLPELKIEPEAEIKPQIPNSVASRLSLPQPARLNYELVTSSDQFNKNNPVIGEIKQLEQKKLSPAYFPDPELDDQKLEQQRLASQLASLKNLAETRKQEFPELQNQYTKLESQMKEITAILHDQEELGSSMMLDSKAREEHQQALGHQLEKFNKQADILTHDINQLSKEILDKEAKKTLPQTLEHKITPVGKIVDGKEIHFRLKNQRIAYLPINELTDSLKRRIMNSRQALLQAGFLEGNIGPVSGFSMKYSISLQDAPVTDQLRNGGNLVRLGVNGWEIVPEKDPTGETEQQAFKKSSLFDAYVANSGPGVTATLWVYPDSYTLARKVQGHLQQLGYRVAARPLPDGVPIIGSPSGSKSVAQ